jgi:hypothetical protein
VPGEMWAGSGNTPTLFTIVSNEDAGVEVALKAKIRQAPDVVEPEDGNLYTVPTGTQSTEWGSQSDNAARAAWSFDFSINADTDDNGVPADFRIQIDFDVDKSAGIDFVTAYNGTIAQYLDGDNTSTDGTVVDNSKNTLFAELSNLFPVSSPYSVDDEGLHTIRLSVFDTTTLLAMTEITVNITDSYSVI